MLRNIIVIQVMNYIVSGASNQNLTQRIINSLTMPQTYPTAFVLIMLSNALSTDFKRYTDSASNRLIAEERQSVGVQPKSEPPKLRAHSQPPLREKQMKVSVPKPIQKSHSIKPSSAAKPQNPKPTSPPTPPTSTLPISEKSIKKPVVQKVVAPCKIKKKNHKIPQVKKENPGRVPRVTLLQTAETPQLGLSEKDRRKLKERLMLRQVKQWKIADQVKRDRRELRTLQ